MLSKERHQSATGPSYGTQLNKVLEALQVLSDAAGVDLPEIDALHGRIAEVKAASGEALKARAEDALARLKAVDEDGWREVLGR